MIKNFLFTSSFVFLLAHGADAAPLKSAATEFSCLNMILQETDFVPAVEHPHPFIFSRISANQFLLLKEDKSFLCKTTSPLKPNIIIHLAAPQGVAIPRRLLYSQAIPQPEKPQTKSASIPLVKGLLPAHVVTDSVIETTAESQNSLQATCEVQGDLSLTKKRLLEVTTAEIKDLFADFAENRDAVAYSWGLKENEKEKSRTDFDEKLKKVFSHCAEVPELRSVVVETIQKIQPKSKIDMKLKPETSSQAPAHLTTVKQKGDSTR